MSQIASVNLDVTLRSPTNVTSPPKEIIAELKALEAEIAEGLNELEAML